MNQAFSKFLNVTAGLLYSPNIKTLLEKIQEHNLAKDKIKSDFNSEYDSLKDNF